MHQERMWATQLGTSLAGKDLEVPIDTKLTQSQLCFLAGKVGDSILGCNQEHQQQLKEHDYSSLFKIRISQRGESEFITIFVQKHRQQGLLILRRECLGALFDM